MASGAAHAALPRPLARAFLDLGVPLDSVAVVVQDERARRPLVSHRADRPMAAASVMKLVTTFAALDMLGIDYRWRTEAYAAGPIDHGVLHGDLVLKGYGDPKITIEQWQTFVQRIRAAGIERVEGDLVLDRTFFDVPQEDPAAFDAAPLRPYNVAPDALLVNFKSVRLSFAPDATGTAAVLTMDPPLDTIHVLEAPALDATAPCADWRTQLDAVFIDRHSSAEIAFRGAFPASCGAREWHVALLDAPSYAHAMFAAYFRVAGGVHERGWREGAVPGDARLVATLESPPLYDIVRDVNKLSNNVMARQLFLTLGAHGTDGPATLGRSNAVVQRWLARRRLAMPGLVLENGSGLSRYARVTARGLARLLLAAERSPVGKEFSSSLAVAAMDGTLQRRFQDGSVAGQALLKTGTLDGVRALAGYVLDADGHRWVVAAIVNHPQAAHAQPALEFLVQWIYRDGDAWAHLIPPH